MTKLTAVPFPAPSVPTEEEKTAMTLEALQDIEDGHLISDQEMQLWFDALESKFAPHQH
jgi:hypothetical protein